MALRRTLLFTTGCSASALNSTITTPGNLCGGAEIVEATSDWLWSHEAVASPSCTSPAVENNAKMCKGDPTSVVIQSNGQSQCLSANMLDCPFNMHDIERLDFDINMLGCGGTWAAPLWMSPDRWKGGGSSGEIDMLENCPSDRVQSNFAGGGNQVHWTFADPNSYQGHLTMWKQPDSDGVMSMHVKACDPSEVTDGVCPEDGAAYLRDIYGLNGCSNGGNCVYHMISDIWNGDAGDGGYQSCAGGHSHESSGCQFSVTNIRFQATPGTFSGTCSAMTGTSPPVPSPAPTPVPTPSPAPTPAGSGLCCYNGCGGSNCEGGFCGQSQGNCEGNCAGEWCPQVVV